VCNKSPTVVGQPFIAIGPKIPLKRQFVKLYVNGFTIKRKISAEKNVICHFWELEAIIYYYHIFIGEDTDQLK
jgi:hypothetical protein